MPRLTTPFSNRVPVLTVNLSVGSTSLAVAGIVDSGADCTLLPKDVAHALGITDADLQQTPAGSKGAGGTSFDTWRTAKQISGQAVIFPPGGQPALWGPSMSLRPTFADETSALWGRDDFFQAFVITFAQDPTYGEVFYLDY